MAYSLSCRLVLNGVSLVKVFVIDNIHEFDSRDIFFSINFRVQRERERGANEGYFTLIIALSSYVKRGLPCKDMEQDLPLPHVIGGPL